MKQYDFLFIYFFKLFLLNVKLFLLFILTEVSYSDNCKGCCATKCNSSCKWLQVIGFIHFSVLLSMHSCTGSQGVIILELAGDAGCFHMVLKTHYALLSNSWNNCRKKIQIMVTVLPFGKIMVKSLQNHAYTLPCMFTTFLHTKCTWCMYVQFGLCFTCVM